MLPALKVGLIFFKLDVVLKPDIALKYSFQ